MKTRPKKNPAFKLKTEAFMPTKERRHRYGTGDHITCVTDTKGYTQPEDRDLKEIRVDATNGHIPLWDKNVTLNWRFSRSFGDQFDDGDAAKAGMRDLLGRALEAWSDACPVKFREVRDGHDFEIAMHRRDCDADGCVLASAFFPGEADRILYIYPTMFEQIEREQLATIVHELGHVFGLRHFFANLSEKQWKSQLFGKSKATSIMNYGSKSKLTALDIRDLKRLYAMVWSGELTEINGTPIKKYKARHM